MMNSLRTLLILFPIVLFKPVTAQQKLLSPREFLGYELGDRFTPHHRVVDYFNHVAQVVPNASVKSYGKTYELRPLIYAMVTSPENFQKLEQIRNDNLIRAGIHSGTTNTGVAIVWLSYNVHGNEANSTEASMKTLYELALAKDNNIKEWLKNVVVIIDPCLNPDGRERYVNFYNQNGNTPYNPNPDAQEHHEPWPYGRFNHYLFDLNRDWAWATQVESRQRLKIYHEWLPHIHVDFHEQHYNSPYFFAPAAEPMHEVITDWQREFQLIIGKKNAERFDNNGWLYFTKEIFDLYYPSYGDTYPTYHGAIGMTYEQGGGPGAGIGVTTETGDELSLNDRISHHYTTGLATIETAATNTPRVLNEFQKYFNDAQKNPASSYKTYIIKGTNNREKLSAFTDWLDLQQIRYGTAEAKSVKAFDYRNQKQTTVTVTKDDIVVSAYQPHSRFLTAIFEPTSKLPDSLTYDITAWNLIYANNFEAYATSSQLSVSVQSQPATKSTSVEDDAYAYVIRYEGVEDATILAMLLQRKVNVRVASKSFVMGSQQFSPGTLVITKTNNKHVPNLAVVVRNAVAQTSKQVFTTPTGFSERGLDLGSTQLKLISAPKIGVVYGEQTSPTTSGEVWYFLEQEIKYPFTHLGTDYLRQVDLSKYDVLIIPDGYYTLFDDQMLDKIASWVSDGGKLILIGSAIKSFSDRKGFMIKTFATDEERAAAERFEKEQKEKAGLPRYGDSERSEISNYIFGAIYQVSLDNSHPLGYGLSDRYFTLKTSNTRYGFLNPGWNVGVVKGEAKPVQGFAGFKANASMKNSLVFGVQEQGSGKIIYLVDNPLFRAFWENGKTIFANALFMN